MATLRLFIGLIISTCCAAQDLSGKVFVFPQETTANHVKLLMSRTEFHQVTVCLRFLTDLHRNYALFSMSTPGHYNAFLIFGRAPECILSINVQDSYSFFQAMSYPANTWHSVCSTWQHDSGVAQIWLNGKPSIKRFIKTGPISGKPIIVLGQEQDSYGGGFDAPKSFVGMISDVHMWDRVLSPAEIRRYMNHRHFTTGNVVNWQSLQYDITGQVLVDDAPDDM